MALQAKQVHVAQLQHVRIWAAVNHVARLAAVHFHRRVLVYEWTLLVHVALEADLVLRRVHSHLLGPLGAMHVVAIAALDEAFIHAMVKGHRELGLLRQMARVAKLWLGLDEQKFPGHSGVRGMARRAAHAVFRVHGIERMHVLVSTGVATEAMGVDVFGGSALEDENLRDVAAARDVCRSGTVAAFASLV